MPMLGIVILALITALALLGTALLAGLAWAAYFFIKKHRSRE